MMRYNLRKIMARAWEIRREKGYSLMTALRLSWAEAKGGKGYAFNLEAARASISAYLAKLADRITDIHNLHKYEILRASLLLPCDREGLAVMAGKAVGLCKYAVRNA